MTKIINTGIEDILYIGPLVKNSFIDIDMAGITHPCPDYYMYHNPDYNVFVFEYVIEGSGYIEYNNKTYTVTAGDSYIIQADIPCIYYADKNEPFKKIWINANGYFVNLLLLAYQLTNPITVVQANTGELISKMHKVLISNSDGLQKELSLILHEIIATIHYEVNHKKSYSLAEQVKNYIDMNITNGITIDSLSSHFSISRTYLMALFKKTFNTTINAYYLEQKIKYACILLERTSLSIKDIANKLCFNDVYYFSNVFKKYKGMSPSHYRKVK